MQAFSGNRNILQELRREKLSEKMTREICRQLSFALDGNLSLSEALTLLAGEADRKKNKKFLSTLLTDIQQGENLSDALRSNPVKTPAVLMQFVIAGEQNGDMVRAIQEADIYFERKDRIKKKLFSALFYPVVILMMSFLAFGLLFVLVVPVIKQTYDNLEAPLPAMTKGVLYISQMFLSYWPMMIGALSAGVLLGAVLWKNSYENMSLRKKMADVLIKVPIVGKVYRNYWFARIGQSIGMLLESGMLPVYAYGAVADIYHKSLFQPELNRLQSQAMNGSSSVEELRRCSFVPEMAKRMLVISEERGNLAELLLNLSAFYQMQMEHALQLLASLIEPIMIILLGFIVLLIAGSLFLPLIESYQYLLM